MFHSRNLECKKPYGAIPAGETVFFSTFPKRERGIESITLWIAEDGQEPQAIPMQWHELIGARDQYCATFTPPHPGLYWYYFTIDLPTGPRYCARGYGGRSELIEALGDRYQLTVYDPQYTVPRWFGEGITYQIFPDRFCRDKLPSLPTGEGISPRVLHENWNDTPVYQPNAYGEIQNNDFFGGTIRGVITKLDYLESLNVRTIYFNPIFQSSSNHRYDTGDYKRVDPLLGCQADFEELCEQATQRGMRVILDGVFNHTGYDSRYFNGRGTYHTIGAYQSKESPYYRWYEFQEWNQKYGCWWGIYTLPQVNEMDESYLHYIIDNANSVIRYWLRLGASGWRLDVADELPDAFIQRLNRAVKQENPEAVIIGEVWEDASNKISYSQRRRYFQGHELDGVMNYPLRSAILAFLNGGTAEHFAETMECLRENYPKEVFYNGMNIISTHDTPRALTLLGIPESDFPSSKEARAAYILPEERLQSARNRLKLAAVLQFTMPGSPTIYYGDEAGVQGFEDPLNRRTYPWGAEDRDLLNFYRRLCHLRAESMALSRGELRFCTRGNAKGALLQFERLYEEARLVILVNRGHKNAHALIDAVYAVDMLTEKGFDSPGRLGMNITVPPETAYILRCFGSLELDKRKG